MSRPPRRRCPDDASDSKISTARYRRQPGVLRSAARQVTRRAVWPARARNDGMPSSPDRCESPTRTNDGSRLDCIATMRGTNAEEGERRAKRGLRTTSSGQLLEHMHRTRLDVEAAAGVREVLGGLAKQASQSVPNCPTLRYTSETGPSTTHSAGATTTDRASPVLPSARVRMQLAPSHPTSGVTNERRTSRRGASSNAGCCWESPARSAGMVSARELEQGSAIGVVGRAIFRARRRPQPETRRQVIIVVASAPSTSVGGVVKMARSPSNATRRTIRVPTSDGSTALSGVSTKIQAISSTS
jgi:hypothetical protein